MGVLKVHFHRELVRREVPLSLLSAVDVGWWDVPRDVCEKNTCTFLRRTIAGQTNELCRNPLHSSFVPSAKGGV